jgi:GNAT superfamily N-acetyltransferase
VLFACAVLTLRIEQPSDDASLEQWRHVHNTIIPTDPLSLDEVRERVRRNRLAVAFAGDELVGCSTVRPPNDETTAATVIVRILPAHRRQGFGEQFYVHELAEARKLDADGIETIILASNTDGLRFAESHGFVEFERDVLPGHTVGFIALRLT